MKYLSLLLSFIIISIIVLSACCLVKGSNIAHSNEASCIGTCLISENTVKISVVDDFIFNKSIFLILIILSVVLNYSFKYFVNKFRQDDFKILFHIDRHIQAGLLHPKIY